MAAVFLSRALSSAGDSVSCTQQVRAPALALGGCLVPLHSASPDLQPGAAHCGLLETIGALETVLGWLTLVDKSEWIPLGKGEFLSDPAAVPDECASSVSTAMTP